MGLRYQHCIASSGLFLIGGSACDHAANKSLLILRGRLMPWLIGQLMFYCAVGGPFTIATKCEYTATTLLLSTQHRWQVMSVMLITIPKAVVSWIALMYLVWSLDPHQIRAPRSTCAGSITYGSLLLSCFYLYWATLPHALLLCLYV